MYIHLLFWNKVDILYFHCTFIITSVLISQMFRLLSCSTSLFFFLLIHGENACSIHLSSKLNNGIKHRSYHRKLVKKYSTDSWYCPIQSICYEIPLLGKSSILLHNRWGHFCETISSCKVSAWLLIWDILMMFYLENPLRVPITRSLGISISHSLTVWHENKTDLLSLSKQKYCSSLKKNVFSILQSVLQVTCFHEVEITCCTTPRYCF